MSEVPTTEYWPATDRPTLPGYEILGELGRGGMGVVYRARQTSTGRPVALKLLRDGALASPQAQARFRIEADAVARMQHPNIVQLYEVGEHSGRPFLVMEFLGGGTLGQHMAGRSLPIAEAVALLQTLALAVAHAHEQQVIHRDLKPANILLSDESRLASLPTLKITDFGLARRLDADSTAWTRDGAILGTPGYMAPEQAAGRAHDVGPSTDVYALGAILYEVLTGRVPFTATSWDQTIQQVLHDEPDRLPAAVPPDLETICLKCLEKEPARRYATAAELADDLGRLLEGRPILATPPSTTERLARQAAQDGYQILDEIGRGPRSIVYLARSQPLQQVMAVKIYSEGLCTREEWDARQRRAAERLAVITHPNVIAIRRTGWWAGAAYLITDLVPSGSLASSFNSKPQPVREAVRLVSQLAEVVVYLHRQGVSHGNLKLSNVLLAADGIPRIADFSLTGGLFQSGQLEEDQGLDGLADLAPESITNLTAEPRPHTDVYGLGLILYQMLTGQHPFVGASVAAIREEVLSRDPVPPSSFNRDVSLLLDSICLRCLRKNPWHRFIRTYDLLIRLRRVLEEIDSPLTRGSGSVH